VFLGAVALAGSVSPGSEIDNLSWRLNPAIGTDGAGGWIIVWEDRSRGRWTSEADLWLTRSTDAGRSWGAPRRLHDRPEAPDQDDATPAIAYLGENVWVIVWARHQGLDELRPPDLDVMYARSTDGGSTWSGPALLAPYAGGDSLAEFNPTVIAGQRGAVIVAWEVFGTVGGLDADLVTIRSADRGATWPDWSLLNANAPQDRGSDFNPRLATDGRGGWLAVWWSDEALGTTGRDFDILFARSTDEGFAWTLPMILNSDAVRDGVADRFPDIATDGSAWVVVWESAATETETAGAFTLRWARSTDAGASWSPPTPLTGEAGLPRLRSRSPRIAVAGVTWLIVWDAAGDGSAAGPLGSDIYSSRSVDGGRTWSSPRRLCPAATPADGDRLSPRVAGDAQGRWVAVWERHAPDGRQAPAPMTARSEDGGATWSTPGEVRPARSPSGEAALP